MCIAVYVPANAIITDEIIENCYDNNPDGAGVMWQENGKVHIKKGFFSVRELIATFREIPVGFNRAIHCRIATSGKISGACCHPFPITKDIKEMMKTEQTVKAAVIHNGIIPFCTPHEGIMAPYSDTMLFTKNYLHPMGDLVLHQCFKNLFEESNTSKLLIFKGNKVALIGDWIEDNGIFYSNDGYKDAWMPKWWKGTSYLSDYDYYGYYDFKDGKTNPDTKKGMKNTSSFPAKTYYDTYNLGFIVQKKEDMDCYEEMHLILEELDKQGCNPDWATPYETYDESLDEFVFEVMCLRCPTTDTVLGHEYIIEVDHW